jgi:hypothetical protein
VEELKMLAQTRIRSATFVAAIAVSSFLGAPHAEASVIPPALQFSLQVNNSAPIFFTPPASQTGPTSWTWQGSYYGDGWSFASTINGDLDPMVNANISFINTSNAVQTYTITVTLPVDPIGPGSTMDGSVGGSITDANGNGFAQVAALAGSSFYQAQIDGNTVQTLLNHPFSASPTFSGGTATFGPASFGQPVQIPGPSVSSTIGIVLQFTLTPGDSIAATSFFRVLPNPAGLALLGIAGLLGRSRRRE